MIGSQRQPVCCMHARLCRTHARAFFCMFVCTSCLMSFSDHFQPTPSSVRVIIASTQSPEQFTSLVAPLHRPRLLILHLLAYSLSKTTSRQVKPTNTLLYATRSREKRRFRSSVPSLTRVGGACMYACSKKQH